MSDTSRRGSGHKRPFRGSRARSVTAYLAALFLITVLLLLLAYFMQERAAQTLISAIIGFT